MATTKKPIEVIDFSKFCTQAQLASFPDGDHEITEERMEIRVHGTTVTHTPIYRFQHIGGDT